MARKFALGVDVGGTFTDFVLWSDDHRSIRSHKVLTTPENPSKAIFDGMDAIAREAGIAVTDIHKFVHATTLVANALIERKGARTALITTQGFRDVLDFRNELRYDLFEPHLNYPIPLIRRRLRYELPERMTAEGLALKTPVRGDVELIGAELRAERVESVAIAFLHSYAFPDHERIVAEYLTDCLPGVPLSLSSEVFPQFREYDRTSAVAINAYVQPLAKRYLSDLVGGLRARGFDNEVFVMTSTGGVVSAATAEQFPILLVESGPAAGVVFASRLAKLYESTGNVVAFDMGGTTAKVTIIREGRPEVSTDHEVARTARFKKGSGLPVGMPVLDLLEVGAGGGSIAEVDALGFVQVGPRSAGADPGPACYGRGGKDPTVTDANIVLGYLDVDAFRVGNHRLDTSLAESAIETAVGQSTAMLVADAASGIHRIVTETMAEALRVRAVESNVDLRAFALIAFGGGAGVHAVEIARRLGIPFVVSPIRAGVFSAAGLLAAPLAVDVSRSRVIAMRDLSATILHSVFEDLRSEARSMLKGTELGTEVEEHAVDMSYIGQEFPITVPLPFLPADNSDLPILSSWFEELYEKTRGQRPYGYPTRVTTWRLRLRGHEPPLPQTAVKKLERPARAGSRQIFLDGQWASVPVYERQQLISGARFAGPCVIQDLETTVLVPFRATVTANEFSSIIIDCRGEGGVS